MLWSCLAHQAQMELVARRSRRFSVCRRSVIGRGGCWANGPARGRPCAEILSLRGRQCLLLARQRQRRAPRMCEADRLAGVCRCWSEVHQSGRVCDRGGDAMRLSELSKCCCCRCCCCCCCYCQLKGPFTSLSPLLWREDCARLSDCTSSEHSPANPYITAASFAAVSITFIPYE